MVEALIWVSCAVVIVTAAVRCRRHPSALRMGRIGMAVLYLVGGAATNAFYLVRGDDYARFADGAYLLFVRHTWHTLVVPNHHLWISMLIAFELAVGVLALGGGRRIQLAYVAVIVFHVALLSFGWGFYLWSLPMIGATATLLRAERRVERSTGEPATVG
jgi:hypothetical protein